MAYAAVGLIPNFRGRLALSTEVKGVVRHLLEAVYILYLVPFLWILRHLLLTYSKNVLFLLKLFTKTTWFLVVEHCGACAPVLLLQNMPAMTFVRACIIILALF